MIAVRVVWVENSVGERALNDIEDPTDRDAHGRPGIIVEGDAIISKADML